MSAETEIASMLSDLNSNIGYLVGKSQTMVNRAIEALEGNVPLRPSTAYADVSPVTLDVDFETAFALPTPLPDFPEMPTLPAPVTETLAAVFLPDGFYVPEFPALNLPAFEYPAVAGMSPFMGGVPDEGFEWSMPDAPDTALPFERSPRLGFVPLLEPDLQVSPPSWMDSPAVGTLPNTSDTTPEWITRLFDGDGGLETLLAHSESNDDLLTALLPEAIRVLKKMFKQKYQPVLAFHAALQQRLTERLEGERNRALAALEDTSGWERPVAVQTALRAAAGQWLNAWARQTNSQFETKTQEITLEFVEACGSLLAALLDGIQGLKAKEVEHWFSAYRFAMTYAKRKVALAVKRHEIQMLPQRLDLKRAEAAQTVYEAQMMVASLRFEVAKAKLQAEESRQENDAALIEQYRQDANSAQRNVALWSKMLAVQRAEIKARQAPLDAFDLKAKAVDQQLDGHQALVELRLAELDGDAALIDARKARVEAFKAEQQGVDTKISALQQVVEMQIDRNEAVIAEFEAKAKAILASIEHKALKEQYNLRVYEAQANDVLTDANIALEKASAALEFESRRQEGLLEAYEMTSKQNIERMEFELDRLKAVAESKIRGADIVERMATGAMSAANGVANVIISES